MSFGNTIQSLISSGHGFRVRGFFNVEGGKVGVANQWYAWCDCTSITQGPAEICEECGRKPGHYVSMVSGDGDGVFVVGEILAPGSEPKVVGALSVFDYQYRMANAARNQIESEQVPSFPLELAMEFATSRPIDLGAIANTGVVYFADGGSGMNSDNATVDIPIAQGHELRVFSFAEDVSNTPEGWADRLAVTQGFERETLDRTMLRGQAGGQAMFESLGIEGPFSLPSFVPRVMMVLEAGLAAHVSLTDQILVTDWAKLGAQFAGSVGTSHAQVMRISTVWVNVLLAREWDRAAGDVVSDERAKELLFDMWTWAYQGALFGDDDCKRMIRSNGYRATPSEVSAMLKRRGLLEAADKAAAGDLPDIGVEPASVSSNGGLTKSTGGLGLTTPPTNAPSSGQAKFCSQCGTAFANESAKFCSGCGAARG